MPNTLVHILCHIISPVLSRPCTVTSYRYRYEATVRTSVIKKYIYSTFEVAICSSLDARTKQARRGVVVGVSSIRTTLNQHVGGGVRRGIGAISR
jgi:hypothetical protein